MNDRPAAASRHRPSVRAATPHEGAVSEGRQGGAVRHARADAVARGDLRATRLRLREISRP